MLNITLDQPNTIDFDLSLNGSVGADVKVTLTIDCGDVAYRFRATQQGESWNVVIPQTLQLAVGEYDFYIDVYMDSHLYPAMADRVQVKAPFKPQATIKQAAAPAVTASVNTTTTPAPEPVVKATIIAKPEVTTTTTKAPSIQETISRALGRHSGNGTPASSVKRIIHE